MLKKVEVIILIVYIVAALMLYFLNASLIEWIITFVVLFIVSNYLRLKKAKSNK